jgi:CrcB protein
MTKLLLAGAGGFLGSAMRYGITVLMAPWTMTFPWSTLLINVVGCFLIGLLLPFLEGKPEGLIFVVTGILGGFTTFSAFGHETHRLAQGTAPWMAVVYVAASVGAGLAAVWIGRGLAK